MCGSRESNEAGGVTKGSQHLDNPNCTKRGRKRRGRDGLGLWERGTAENTPRAHALTLRRAGSLISREDSHKLCKHSQAAATRVPPRRCAPSCLLPLSHRGIALRGTSTQLLPAGSILSTYLLISLLSNMAHAEDLSPVVISISGTVNGGTYMLRFGAHKCRFSRTERAEGNADLPAARQGRWPLRTRQVM